MTTMTRKDITKAISRVLKKTEQNSNRWLHTVGLSRYQPGKQVLEGLTLFAAGGLLGTALTLLFAPQPGKAFRRDVREKTRDILSRGEKMRALLEEAKA